MIHKLRSPGARVAIVSALGFVLAIMLGLQNVQAVSGLNALWLPDLGAQLGYEQLVNPVQSAQQLQAAFARSASMRVSNSLPTALSSQPTTSNSSTSKILD